MAAPLEWWLRGRPAGAAQLAGLALTVAGVVGYRRAGRTLGEQLTPLVAPAEPAALVERGPYALVRHPMYLAEIAMAFGFPIVLNARWTLVGSACFMLAVIRRIAVEERALAERLPEYPDYVRRTSRLIPPVY